MMDVPTVPSGPTSTCLTLASLPLTGTPVPAPRGLGLEVTLASGNR